MPDARRFCASFCVKVDTKRTRFECASATDYGGPEGQFRVRMNRRWLDMEDGNAMFFDRDRLANTLVSSVFGGIPEPAQPPDIPMRSRISVRRMRDGEPYMEGAWTLSPPILAADGRWMVAVTLFDGVTFVPVDECQIRAKQKR